MNYIEKIIPIVKSVGDQVMQHYRTDLKITMKDKWSFYTQADLASQQRLEKELKNLIPNSGVIAEEKNLYNKDEFTWVIDPIDGTRNFVRGLPYFGISVALMHNLEIIAGVVYMPAMGDIVTAQKGFGTLLNGKKIIVNESVYQSAGCLIVSSASSQAKIEKIVAIKKLFLNNSAGISFRSAGAAAVDLAYAAVGAYDAVLFEGLKWWDVAAGKLLIEEARGYVSDYQGNELSENFRTVIAGNKIICKKILAANII